MKPTRIARCIASATAVAWLAGCSYLPTRAPGPSGSMVAPTPEPAPAPAPAPAASESGGLLGAIGGLFGSQSPDPTVSPEEFASLQLEEMARAMDEDLRGTPVELQRPEANMLRVLVPANFCFDAGRSAVKQPLAAVLDRMAAQLKSKGTLQVTVAGPADARDGNPLRALDRAAAARDYLIARGVPASRFSVESLPNPTGLEMRVLARKGLRGSLTEPARAPAPR